jgi:hypothetical protein
MEITYVLTRCFVYFLYVPTGYIVRMSDITHFMVRNWQARETRNDIRDNLN